MADVINRFLQNLIIMCSKTEGVRDFYHVGVIGYGETVGSSLRVVEDETCLVRISELAEYPLRIEERARKFDDGAGGIVEQAIKFPVWFEPVARGRTFMAEALELCATSVSDFILLHPDCYPPIVINITDGASDSPPEQAAASLRSLASRDGNVLLFNIHISHLQNQPIVFPASEHDLPDAYANMLFRMSSQLPPSMLELANTRECVVSQDARGFVFNGDLVSVIRFIDIGTRHSRARRLGFTP